MSTEKETDGIKKLLCFYLFPVLMLSSQAESIAHGRPRTRKRWRESFSESCCLCDSHFWFSIWSPLPCCFLFTPSRSLRAPKRSDFGLSLCVLLSYLVGATRRPFQVSLGCEVGVVGVLGATSEGLKLFLSSGFLGTLPKLAMRLREGSKSCNDQSSTF